MINKNIKIPGLGTTEFNKLKQNATKQPKTSNTQDEDYDPEFAKEYESIIRKSVPIYHFPNDSRSTFRDKSPQRKPSPPKRPAIQPISKPTVIPFKYDKPPFKVIANDPTTFVNIVVQKLFKTSVTQTSQQIESPSSRNQYQLQVSVNTGDFILSASGIGTSKKIAKQIAMKNLYFLMLNQGYIPDFIEEQGRVWFPSKEQNSISESIEQ